MCDGRIAMLTGDTTNAIMTANANDVVNTPVCTVTENRRSLAIM